MTGTGSSLSELHRLGITFVSMLAMTFPRKWQASSTASFSRSRWASIRVK